MQKPSLAFLSHFQQKNCVLWRVTLQRLNLLKVMLVWIMSVNGLHFVQPGKNQENGIIGHGETILLIRKEIMPGITLAAAGTGRRLRFE